MKRLPVIIAVLVAAWSWSTAAAQDNDTLRVGIVQSLFRYANDAEAKSSMGQFETFMKNRTGLGGEFVTVKDAYALAEQLSSDKVRFGTFHGIEFAWAKQKYPKLTPLVVAVNQDSHLRAHLLVSKDSAATEFADLKGKSLAIPAGTREHCRLFLERRCMQQRQEQAGFFGDISKPANSEDALDDTVDGMVQAVLVDNASLELFKSRKPARFARLKEIEKSEVFPTGTVAYLEGSVDDQTLDKVKKSLLTAQESADGRQILFTWKLSAFERVPSDYAKIVTDIVKSYPPPGK